MPELPEVETVVRTLEKQISKATIKDIEIRYGKVLDNIDEVFFKSALINNTFEVFTRRGKYLHFILNGYDLYVHLRMEGKFYIFDNYQETQNKHIHIVFTLNDGRYLCYHDTRKFGRFYLCESNQSIKNITKLGYEPLSKDFNADILYTLLQKSKQDLKTFLLDQEMVCGLGNIYVNEVCFKLRVYPGIKANTLNRADALCLYDAIYATLSNAIEAGGTTIRSYTSSLGVSGLFQLQVLVHGKVNSPCVTCSTPIKKIMLHQRGTYYCPKCQNRGFI